MSMPAVQAAHSPQPAPIDRKIRCGIPGGKPLPWRRSASTAIISRRLRIAKSEIRLAEVAGPSPVLVQNRSVANPEVGDPFLDTMPERKSAGCDLLHIGSGRLVLNFPNGPENLPITARPQRRPRHRLCLDRGGRRGGADSAGLSHSDLIALKRRPGTHLSH